MQSDARRTIFFFIKHDIDINKRKVLFSGSAGSAWREVLMSRFKLPSKVLSAAQLAVGMSPSRPNASLSISVNPYKRKRKSDEKRSSSEFDDGALDDATLVAALERPRAKPSTTSTSGSLPRTPTRARKAATKAPEAKIDFDLYCLDDAYLVEALDAAEKRVQASKVAVQMKKRAKTGASHTMAPTKSSPEVNESEGQASAIEFDSYCLEDQLLCQALDESEALIAERKSAPIISQVDSSNEGTQESLQSSIIPVVTPVKSGSRSAETTSSNSHLSAPMRLLDV